MVNYANGKIYKIEPICDHEEGEIYIGSTTKMYLSQRMDTHRNKFRQFQAGTYAKVSVFEMFEKYGSKNCQIILLEMYPCESRDELLAKEAHYIKTFECVNKRIPLKRFEEIKIARKEYKKQYYIKNKDIIAAKKKIYKINLITKNTTHHHKVNNEVDNSKVLHHCLCGGQYTQSNKTLHLKTKKHQKYLNNNNVVPISKKEKGKIYREKNRERLHEKFNCLCGGCYRYNDKSNHEKTNKHREYIRTEALKQCLHNMCSFEQTKLIYNKL